MPKFTWNPSARSTALGALSLACALPITLSGQDSGCAEWTDKDYTVTWASIFVGEYGTAVITNSSGEVSSTGGYLTISNEGSKHSLFFVTNGTAQSEVRPHAERHVYIASYRTNGDQTPTRLPVRVRWCSQDAPVRAPAPPQSPSVTLGQPASRDVDDTRQQLERDVQQRVVYQQRAAAEARRQAGIRAAQRLLQDQIDEAAHNQASALNGLSQSYQRRADSILYAMQHPAAETAATEEESGESLSIPGGFHASFSCEESPGVFYFFAFDKDGNVGGFYFLPEKARGLTSHDYPLQGRYTISNNVARFTLRGAPGFRVTGALEEVVQIEGQSMSETWTSLVNGRTGSRSCKRVSP